MSLISDLWKLQEIDVALDSRRAARDDAEAQLGEREDVLAARARSEELESQVSGARSAQRDLDTEASDIRAKIGPLETKLYSGSIRQPKELADLQAEIESLKRHLATVEDRDLEALSVLETAEGEARAGAAERDALELSWKAEQDDLHARIDRLAGEIAVLDTQRRAQAEYVPGETLKMYDRLRVAHQGRALARLERNLCTGCRISLPANLVTRARAGSTLVQCPNCERILVV